MWASAEGAPAAAAQLTANDIVFTIAFHHGRVASQTTYSSDNVATSGRAGDAPFMEEVRFVYQHINWRYEPDGIEFEDSWGMV